MVGFIREKHSRFETGKALMDFYLPIATDVLAYFKDHYKTSEEGGPILRIASDDVSFIDVFTDESQHLFHFAEQVTADGQSILDTGWCGEAAQLNGCLKNVVLFFANNRNPALVT